MPETKKKCVECEREYGRKYGETGKQYELRIYCSRMCIEAWQKRNIASMREETP